jgi:glucokinase
MTTTPGSSKHAVGIDFGGTSIKLGLVGEQGKILAREVISTGEVSSREEWFDAVAAGLETLRREADVYEPGFAGIGMGVPGFVDFERGYVYQLTNVSGWDGVHLAREMEDRFKTRSYVDNDVNAMALGECTFGAGRLFEHAVFVTLGTGVGGALLIHNRLYRGAYSMAGEIGHIPIQMYGRTSPEGRGGVEQYIGNRRIVQRTVRALERGQTSMISDLAGGDLTKISPKIIAEAAHQGDPLGIEIFDFVADCLATVFAGITYCIQPQVFIVGGGVAQSGAVLFDPLRRHLQERLSRHFAERIQVKPATLGNDAGMIGSATLALLA